MNIPPLQPEFCIEYQIFKTNKRNITLYCIVVLVLFLALLSMPFVYVDIVIRGVGSVRPKIEKAQILAPCSDFIGRLCAHEGDLLQKGDAIIVLNTTSYEADILAQTTLIKNLSDQIADLKILAKGQTPALFRSPKREQEYLLHRQQTILASAQVTSANRKLKRNRALFESNVVSADEFENFEIEALRLEGEKKTLIENQRTVWESELSAIIQQLNETHAQLIQLRNDKEKATLRAPVQGYLEEFSGIHEGMNVTSGQQLGIVSPNANLIVENFIEPKDIGFLYIGMPVKIVSESFDCNLWGYIQGHVTDIASDYQLIDNQPYYKIKCSLDQNYVARKDGKKGYLKKGMTVQTRFLADRRSLLQLVYQKMDNWMNPSLPNTKK